MRLRRPRMSQTICLRNRDLPGRGPPPGRGIAPRIAKLIGRRITCRTSAPRRDLADLAREGDETAREIFLPMRASTWEWPWLFW